MGGWCPASRGTLADAHILVGDALDGDVGLDVGVGEGGGWNLRLGGRAFSRVRRW